VLLKIKLRLSDNYKGIIGSRNSLNDYATPDDGFSLEVIRGLDGRAEFNVLLNLLNNLLRKRRTGND
jgi:hypothetical protein